MRLEYKTPALAELTEAQREQAMSRFQVLRSHTERGVSLPRAAQAAGVGLRTLERWLAQYLADGLAGLVRQTRQDRGRRKLPAEAVELIEGLFLKKPRPSVAAVHRRVLALCKDRAWPSPSYSSVYAIISRLDPALTTLAHEGPARFRDQFERVYRHRASHPNAIWQADHTQLDVLIRGASGEPIRPWLTTVIDDHSRALAGYLVFAGAPSAFQTSLALRQAIWRKADPSWAICGIPDVLYVDHGSDFTSKHLEQVAVDLHFELVYSTIARPQGRGKIERLFGTLNTELLPELPGYLKHGKPTTEPKLSLSELDRAIGNFLLGTYNARVHREIGIAPQTSWSGNGWLPRMPDSLEDLDLLLISVAKARTVHRDGIHFQGIRYMDPTLAAYVKEAVTIRYDPRDVAEIRVFHRNRFLCRAVSPEHSGQAITLKDIQTARSAHRRALRGQIRERVTPVADFLAPHAETTAPPAAKTSIPQPKKSKLHTYREDLEMRITKALRRAEAFIVTKEHRRFMEFANVVRKERYIGLCYGAAGVGKTQSARRYAHWQSVEPLPTRWGPRDEADKKVYATLARSRVLFFTPDVRANFGALRHQIDDLLGRINVCIDQHTGKTARTLPWDYVELVVLDEAERLNTAALEYLRDLFDRNDIGLILIGMPGIEKRMSRYPQLYSRVGFAHHYRPLLGDELSFVLARHWQKLGLQLDGADFTDAQAVANIARITGGNFRLLRRLFLQIERVLRVNDLTVVTDDVVNAARSTLVIGVS